MYPGRRTFCRLWFFQLPWHDGGTVAVGLVQVGGALPQAAGVPLGLPLLPGHAARHHGRHKAQEKAHNKTEKEARDAHEECSTPQKIVEVLK